MLLIFYFTYLFITKRMRGSKHLRWTNQNKPRCTNVIDINLVLFACLDNSLEYVAYWMQSLFRCIY